MQTCNQCKKDLPLSNFYFDKRYNNHQKKCRVCCAKNKKDRWDKNPEQFRDYQRKYRIENRDDYNLYMKTYKEKNSEKIKEINKKCYVNGGAEKKKVYDKKRLSHTRERDRKRYKEDLQYRLKKIIRSRIRKFVSERNESSSNILDCTLEFYLKYLEIQFDNNMSWENYGTYWNIDHIIPCATFDFTCDEQVKICFHWTNTKPMIKSLNESKQDTINEIEIKSHITFLQEHLPIKINIAIPNYSRKGIMAQRNELGYGNNSSDVKLI